MKSIFEDVVRIPRARSATEGDNFGSPGLVSERRPDESSMGLLVKT